LKKMMPSQCTVVRDGAEARIDAADLVPGDLIRLGIGDRIPVRERREKRGERRAPARPPVRAQKKERRKQQKIESHAPPPPPPTHTKPNQKQADARVIQSYGLKVEQSSLTGESDLVPVGVDRRSDEALEARNLVFAGCLVMMGSGRAVVVKTGDRSMIGRIASLASSPSGSGGDGGGGGGNSGSGDDGNGNGNGKADRGAISGNSKTTLQIEIDHLVRFVGAVCVVVPTVLFAIGAARRRLSVLDAFLNGFVLAVVACVLQGMRATVLSLLALCSTRLREKNVLIKKTNTIDNLGCATVICSDKTGTLTQNVMTVQSVWVGGAGARRHGADAAAAALAMGGGGGMGMGMGGGRGMGGMGGGSNGGGAASGVVAVDASLAALAALPAAADQIGGTGGSGFAWQSSSTLAKLVIVATVCNKAQFAGGQEAGGGAGGGAGSGSGASASAPGSPDSPPDGAVAVSLFTPVPETDAKDPKGGPEPPQLLGDATDCGLLRFADRSVPSAQVRFFFFFFRFAHCRPDDAKKKPTSALHLFPQTKPPNNNNQPNPGPRRLPQDLRAALQLDGQVLAGRRAAAAFFAAAAVVRRRGRRRRCRLVVAPLHALPKGRPRDRRRKMRHLLLGVRRVGKDDRRSL
jgi:hypothetical protein